MNKAVFDEVSVLWAEHMGRRMADLIINDPPRAASHAQ